MTALPDLQRCFQTHVLGEADIPPAIIADTGAISAAERLHIYSEAIRLRFIEVLGDDYPGLYGLVGDDTFHHLGGAYATAHPSHNRSIRWFGRYLPEFLHTMAPWRDHPVLAEMARFEWARSELVDAADSSVIGVEDITGIPPDRWAEIQPRLKPAVRQLTLEWNVPSLWSAINDGDTPPSPTRTEQAVHWLLWREDIRIHWRSIDLDEAWALQICAAGANFGAICTGLCERVGEDAAAYRAATYLKQWVTNGLLDAI